MKVFISWSGTRSRIVAAALRDWLPNVLQAVQPWMSDADIEKGSRWSTDVGVQLQEARVGIICLTPESITEPWVLFEAGALSKTLENTFVCTYLFDLDTSDLTWPLALFQATKNNREDTRKLLGTLNRALGANSLPDARLDDIFDVWWPRLEDRLKTIPQDPGQRAQAKRSEGDVLSEILDLVRDQTVATNSVVAQTLSDVSMNVERMSVKLVNAIRHLEDTLESFAASSSRWAGSPLRSEPGPSSLAARLEAAGRSSPESTEPRGTR
jgi:hypothetical protein